MKNNVFFLAMILFAATSLVFSSCSKDDDKDEEQDTTELIAAFTADGEFRPAPQEIIFTNNSQNAVSYLWDFGDGATSEEENPTHIYESAGEYEITLTATGADGATKTKTASIELYEPVTGFALEDLFIDQEIFGDSPNTSDPDDGGLPDVTFKVEMNGQVVLDPDVYYGNYEFSEDYSTVVFSETEIEALPHSFGMNDDLVFKIYDYDEGDYSLNLIAEYSFNMNDFLDANYADNTDPYPANANVDADDYLSFNFDWEH